MICTVPSFLCFIFLLPMPESPKFLMSRGRNDEALAVFQLIYKINHKNSSKDYPVSIYLYIKYLFGCLLQLKYSLCSNFIR